MSPISTAAASERWQPEDRVSELRPIIESSSYFFPTLIYGSTAWPGPQDPMLPQEAAVGAALPARVAIPGVRGDGARVLPHPPVRLQ